MIVVVSFEEARLVTLDFDPATTSRFEALRREHYPPNINRVPAHVMLFHKLPAEEDAALRFELARTAASIASFAVTVEAPYSLGHGVAYRLKSAELLSMRSHLAAAWTAWLTPQDRERYRPHVVVQNKVDAATADRTLKMLQDRFVPFVAQAVGLVFSAYRGGTWHDPVKFQFPNRVRF